jgi:uncharacterized protein YkwD
MLNKYKKIRFSYKTKKVASLIILLALIISPIAIAKKPTTREIAKAIENTQTPTLVPSPAESKSPESTPTPEPVKTEAKQTPTPLKNRAQRPVGTDGTSNTKAPTASQPRTSNNSSTINQPSNPTPAPQPAASGILGYINQVRAENGLSHLTYNSELNSAARAKSQDMLEKNYFSHTSPDGKSDFEFIKSAGYTYSFAGSNIAKGSFTEKSVFDAWMASPGHRANILDSRAREFGYGVAGTYFTMMVGAR